MTDYSSYERKPKHVPTLYTIFESEDCCRRIERSPERLGQDEDCRVGCWELLKAAVGLAKRALKQKLRLNRSGK